MHFVEGSILITFLLFSCIFPLFFLSLSSQAGRRSKYNLVCFFNTLRKRAVCHGSGNSSDGTQSMV